MALTLSDFTSNDTVRGLLGVNAREVEDADLTALEEGHLLAVTLALEDINETVPDMFEAIKDKDEAARTTLEQRMYGLTRMLASTLVARSLAGGSVALFAPKRLSDGKAEQERVQDPFEALRANLNASYALWLDRLTSVVGRMDVVTASRPVVTYVGGVGLAVDPVTGV